MRYRVKFIKDFAGVFISYAIVLKKETFKYY